MRRACASCVTAIVVAGMGAGCNLGILEHDGGRDQEVATPDAQDAPFAEARPADSAPELPTNVGEEPRDAADAGPDAGAAADAIDANGDANGDSAGATTDVAVDIGPACTPIGLPCDHPCCPGVTCFNGICGGSAACIADGKQCDPGTQVCCSGIDCAFGGGTCLTLGCALDGEPCDATLRCCNAKDGRTCTGGICVRQPPPPIDASEHPDRPEDSTGSDASDARSDASVDSADDAQACECEPAAARCGPGGGIQPCVVNATGCPSWGAESPCGPHMHCGATGAAAACACDANACTGVPSSRFCDFSVSPPTTVLFCETDTAGCRFVAGTMTCSGGLVCGSTPSATFGCVCPFVPGCDPSLFISCRAPPSGPTAEACFKGADGCMHVQTCTPTQTCVSGRCSP